MQRLFYALIAVLVRGASRCMFSRIEIRGRDRIPSDQPCVFSPNHQNSFLDALLVGAFAPVKMGYLTRSDVFGTRFDWFLEALEMVPIYRRRDGLKKVARNKAILERQRERLRQGGSLLIFSEANHAHTYYLRPLSKGSARFALEAQASIDGELLLFPVGINYYHFQRPGFKVSIVFGEPIAVDTYAAPSDAADTPAADTTGLDASASGAAQSLRLRDELARRMRHCLLIPEKTDDYRDRVDYINRKNEDRPFPEMRRALQEPTDLSPKGPPRPWLETIAAGISVLNAPPLWTYRWALRTVDDHVFAASLKLAVGMFLLPVWWILLFVGVTLATGWGIGAAVALLAILTLALRIMLIRYANPPHRLD
jgi:1-acyl-sn-glycerol-3-phosphate acyltransferase